MNMQQMQTSLHPHLKTQRHNRIMTIPTVHQMMPASQRQFPPRTLLRTISPQAIQLGVSTVLLKVRLNAPPRRDNITSDLPQRASHLQIIRHVGERPWSFSDLLAVDHRPAKGTCCRGLLTRRRRRRRRLEAVAAEDVLAFGCYYGLDEGTMTH